MRCIYVCVCMYVYVRMLNGELIIESNCAYLYHVVTFYIIIIKGVSGKHTYIYLLKCLNMRSFLHLICICNENDLFGDIYWFSLKQFEIICVRVHTNKTNQIKKTKLNIWLNTWKSNYKLNEKFCVYFW